MTKICKVCKIEKSLDEFYKDAKTPGGHRHNCKQCKNKLTAKWRNENREHYNSIAREHHKKHYQKFRLQRYDMTVEQHHVMLKEQKSSCQLCGKIPKGKRPLAVDHDHKTGKVRGLLCYKCNRDMSIVDDDVQLEKCIEYRNKNRT